MKGEILRTKLNRIDDAIIEFDRALELEKYEEVNRICDFHLPSVLSHPSSVPSAYLRVLCGCSPLPFITSGT